MKSQIITIRYETKNGVVSKVHNSYIMTPKTKKTGMEGENMKEKKRYKKSAGNVAGNSRQTTTA